MLTRRDFLNRGAQAGLITATSAFWGNAFASRALAQSATGSYKAIVVITLVGGNDGNNTLIPIDPAPYAEYCSLRSGLALPIASIIPLRSSAGSPTYGLHPSLTNIASLYNSGRALAVAGVGPLVQPATKDQLFSGAVPCPPSVGSHLTARLQWESAQAVQNPTSGWGGRIADVIGQKPGLPSPMLNASVNSLFTVGNTVQAVTLQGGDIFAPVPPNLNSVVLQIAQNDANSKNALVSQVAKFRSNAMQQQVLIAQAAQSGAITTPFPSSGLGQTMKKIAEVINGRSILGADRQIFYAQQSDYDTHFDQLNLQATLLTDLDASLGAFFNALDTLGLSNQVLVCTHSDFSRSMTMNSEAGSDHAWASTHFVIGGGINGGRILGTMPEPELGGSSDLTTGLGIFIPTTSVTQMAAGVGNWMGLNKAQLGTVFPELSNFPAGMLQLT